MYGHTALPRTNWHATYIGTLIMNCIAIATKPYNSSLGSHPIIPLHHTVIRDYWRLGQSGYRVKDRGTYKLLYVSYNLIPDKLTIVGGNNNHNHTRNISEIHRWNWGVCPKHPNTTFPQASDVPLFLLPAPCWVCVVRW